MTYNFGILNDAGQTIYVSEQVYITQDRATKLARHIAKIVHATGAIIYRGDKQVARIATLELIT